MGNHHNTGLQIYHAHLDGKPYYVVPTQNAQEAAELLAETNDFLQAIIRHMIIMYNRHTVGNERIANGIGILMRRYPSVDALRLYELDTRRTHSFAYNQDKVHMYLCIRKNGLPDETLADPSTVLYVALHELAHSMCNGYAPTNGNNETVHDQDFRDKEMFLWTIANTFGFLDATTMPGTVHCGHELPNPAQSV